MAAGVACIVHEGSGRWCAAGGVTRGLRRSSPASSPPDGKSVADVAREIIEVRAARQRPFGFPDVARGGRGRGAGLRRGSSVTREYGGRLVVSVQKNRERQTDMSVNGCAAALTSASDATAAQSPTLKAITICRTGRAAACPSGSLSAPTAEKGRTAPLPLYGPDQHLQASAGPTVESSEPSASAAFAWISHVQVAGGSLAGNDASLISSTVTSPPARHVRSSRSLYLRHARRRRTPGCGFASQSLVIGSQTASGSPRLLPLRR